MKNLITKQKLLNSLTGIAAASLLAASPNLFAAGGSASAGTTGANDSQSISSSQNSGMGQQQDQQRVTGTQNSELNQEQDSQGISANEAEQDSEGLAATENNQDFNTAGSGGNLNQTDEQQSTANSDINRQNEEQGFASTDSEFGEEQNSNTNINSEQDLNAQSGQELSAMSPEELKDLQVVNQNGEDLGDVQEVVTDADGSVSGVVVSVGGILGMGASDIYASADELEAEQDQLVWQTDLSEDELADQRQEYQAASN